VIEMKILSNNRHDEKTAKDSRMNGFAQQFNGAVVGNHAPILRVMLKLGEKMN